MTASSHTTIAQSLIESYLNTEYRALGDLPITLRAGVANPDLGAVLKSFKAENCVFITACNPRSHLFHTHDNEHRQVVLETEISSLGLKYLPGIAVDPFGAWPDEPSFLVFGLALKSAKALAARHEQNAVLWCGLTCIPELILLR
jgi:hypothetical protein